MTTSPAADSSIDLRRRARSLPGWVAIVAVASIVAVPVVVTIASILEPNTAVWRELWNTRLPGMIRDTVTLLVTVVVGSTVLGTGLAWLVTAHRFPGRRLLGWALVTPLAMPGYVLGFVWLDTLQGPLGARSVRSIWLCAAVLTMAYFPYVYLLARAAFRDQSASSIAVARSLGCTPWAAWWRVTLPMARPSIAAGAALVAMEVLTDVGTVRLFNVSTIADGVLRVWFGTGDRNAAAELATLLIGAAVLLILVERLLRGRARYTQGGRMQTVAPRPTGLGGTLALMAVGWGVVAVAVGIPLVKLIRWVREARATGQNVAMEGDLGHHVSSSLQVAGAATIVCLVAGVTLAWLARRRGIAGQVVARVATLGYAVPGPVVAVGVVITLAALDRFSWIPGSLLLVGSLVGLVYALTVRFLAVSYQGVDASLSKVPPNVVAGARTLGAGPWRVATRIELPLIRTGLLASAALVAIDAMKELPITLLLRPFGMDTLSVWVWRATSESFWVQAAVPSLAIVGIGMVPVAVLLWALERGAEVTT
ncbi:MAG: ABC transporter permease [Ilumatobacter sp.]|uniref:ABC transporter permease n=1 Tax=Ilumatobacter sp. TaxID=1967498 RepID=UPI00391D5B76